MSHASRSARIATPLSAALAVCLLATPALTQGPVRRTASEVSLRPPSGLRSRSVRYPWDGRLMRGMRLKQSQYVRYVDEYAQDDRFFGTWELVQLLERGARRVAFKLPGSKLSVGELSSPVGGDIGGHNSHESGRDVDVSFYMTTADGKPYDARSFAEFDARGRGLAPNGGLRFDDARNWELVSKLVTDADARVQYMFVARSLRERLLQEARRRGAAASVIERAESVLVQPARGHAHRNHFHMRIYCAPADRPLCRDVGPYWSWYPGVAPDGLYASNASLAKSPLGVPLSID